MKGTKSLRWMVAALLCLSWAPTAPALDLDEVEEDAAMPLTYDPGETPIKVKYKILKMDADGEISEARERERFSKDDRIRFVFESESNGYLYLFQQNADGVRSRLFPDPRILEGSNAMRRNRPLTLPEASGPAWWRFDSKPGEDVVTVVFSRKPLPELDEAMASDADTAIDDAWGVVAGLAETDFTAEGNSLTYDAGAFNASAKATPLVRFEIKLRHGR